MKSKAVLAARKVRLICLDVDGVLTDGLITFSEDISGDCTETKCFDVQDGHGIKLAQRAGYTVAFITGRESNIVARRAEELEVAIVKQGAKIKIHALIEILKDLKLKPEQVLYMGDDLVDIPVMRRVGLAVAPLNAIPDVKRYALFVTKKRGGNGAVREVIDWLLKTTGNWDSVTGVYFE